MRPHGLGKTDPGRKRKNNEDRLLVDDELGLYAVCDGMGGHAAGEVASSTALEAAARFVRGRVADLSAERPVSELSAVLAEACQTASREVHELARSRPEYQGMGCTLTLLLVRERRAVAVHVGDTRLYLYREGTLSQLTKDHTLAEELVAVGVIPSYKVRTHPGSHVLTRALGGADPVRVDTSAVEVRPGDVFLLCSDGLTNYIERPEWLAREIASERLESLPDALIEFANRSGGDDNVSVVAVHVEEDESDRARHRPRWVVAFDSLRQLIQRP